MIKICLTALLILTMNLPLNAMKYKINIPDLSISANHTDIKDPSGTGLDFQRRYNSRSSYNGILGRSWGTRFETRIEILSNATLAIFPWGCGSARIYSPVDLPEKIRSKIAALYQKKWKAQRFPSENILQRKIWQILPSGQEFTAVSGEKNTVQKTPSGYTYPNNEKTKFFNFSPNGALLSILKPDKTGIHLQYNWFGAIEKISAANNYVFRFKYNNAGHLIQLNTPGDSWPSFVYDKNKRLFRFINDAKFNTEFEYHCYYNSSGRLAQITEIDTTSSSCSASRDTPFEYFPNKVKHQIRLVSAANGNIYKYKRSDDKKNSIYTIKIWNKYGYYTTKYTLQTKYDCYYRINNNGSRVYYKVSVKDKKGQRIYFYNQRQQLSKIKNKKGISTYIYDQKARVKIKKGPLFTIYYTYHPSFNKISSRILVNKKSGQKQSDLFYYDKNGDIIRYRGTNKKMYHIQMNKQQLVTRIQGPSSTIVIKYDLKERPVEYILKGKGRISVTYRMYDSNLVKIFGENQASVKKQIVATLTEIARMEEAPQILPATDPIKIN